MKKLKPLFKWTGGKNKMRQKYGDSFIPHRNFDTFIDCFYGAGAITHWVYENNPNAHFVINDFNAEMVNIYIQLRDKCELFIEKTKKLEAQYLSVVGIENRKKFYNEIKLQYCQRWKEELTPLDEAVNLHFMMKINFNGWWKTYLYSNGRYATPPGVLNESRSFIDYDNLTNTSEFFKNKCTIMVGDFEQTESLVNENTFIYFDPPYRDSTTNYTEEGFNENDQIRLCKYFIRCDEKGALVSLSNKEIGDGFFETNIPNRNYLKMDVKYTAGRGTTINNVQEILVCNYKNEKVSLQTFFA